MFQKVLGAMPPPEGSHQSSRLYCCASAPARRVSRSDRVMSPLTRTPVVLPSVSMGMPGTLLAGPYKNCLSSPKFMAWRVFSW